MDSASAIAKRFNVSELIIGLTIVAFGTSTPELVVSAISAFSGNSGIAIGNVLGSNVANICSCILHVLGVFATRSDYKPNPVGLIFCHSLVNEISNCCKRFQI